MEDGNSTLQLFSFDPLAKLLRQAAPRKAADLDAILSRLQPICELDRQSDRILFQARPSPCTIRIGIECTRRLQAHTYAAGIFFSTPECLEMGIEECRKLYAPADHLLNWAVSRELQQSLKHGGMDDSLDDLLAGLGKELPVDILSSLNDTQRLFGYCLFRFAIAFILLHELAHQEYRHTFCEGYWSIQQENDSDRFAADWLLEGASRSTKALQSNRCYIPVGIAVCPLVADNLQYLLGASSDQDASRRIQPAISDPGTHSRRGRPAEIVDGLGNSCKAATFPHGYR